ncbi:MAG: family N-acetyltransferase [Devosia sp.]|nr:family N-acetyltransferase [Devosia sp.]
MAVPIIMTVPVFSTLCNAAFTLRRQVFVWEQHVPPEEELDADDLTATHFVAVSEGEVAGTLRLIERADDMKIGRVAVHPAFRSRGIAKAMMLAAMAHAKALGCDRFYLTAQTDKVQFYERLGYVAYGEEFTDGGMPHLAMKTY